LLAVSRPVGLLSCAYGCACDRYWRLNRQPDRHEAADSDPKTAFMKFCSVVRVLDVSGQITDWFFGCRMGDLRRDNIADLIAYGFWYTTREQMESEGKGEALRDALRLLKESAGVDAPPGYNAELRFRSHLWNALPGVHFPLAFYTFMEVLGCLSHVGLILGGFTKRTHDDLTYFVHGLPAQEHPQPYSDSRPGKVPIVFMHGIGIGLLPYLGWVQKLRQMGHPLIVIECRHISMRLNFSTPTVDDTVSLLVSVLDGLQISSVGLVSHSYGTFIASRFANLHRHRVASQCFIDPVCFVMHNPTLLKNFVYRRLSFRSIRSLLRSAIMLLVAREPSIAASVCRRFAWSQLNQWPDELPDRTVIVLSALDELVPVGDVKELMEHSGRAHVLIHPTYRHAQFLMSPTWQATILDRITKVCL